MACFNRALALGFSTLNLLSGATGAHVRNVIDARNAGVGSTRPAFTLDELFARLDTDGDGRISWEEAQQDPDLVRVFARADYNRDGELTRGEFEQAVMFARDQRRGRNG
jgi:hypothetical protein